MRTNLLNGDVRTVPLADKSVHCIVTSPPYWGLRDYGTGEWVGGDAECDHIKKTARNDGGRVNTNGFHGSATKDSDKGDMTYSDTCPKCSATRVDKQLGSEPLHDCGGWVTGDDCGTCFVCSVRQYALEFWRVLRDDGTWWLNLGDSYNGSGGAGGDYNSGGLKDGQPRFNGRNVHQLKPKDLCGIPWRIALALQADGWYLRSDIIWAKPNPMPESVTDRPTKAHEYLFLLTKNKRYFYDADAVREKGKPESEERYKYLFGGPAKKAVGKYGQTRPEGTREYSSGRNRRTVWRIATAPYSGAHFATFPPKLVEPCIKAGTSEHGCCPECGKQWVRVVEKVAQPSVNFSHKEFIGDSRFATRPVGKNGATHAAWKAEHPDKFLGFRPDCEHGHEPIPATVFDPFAGSGTTIMVANQLGRRGVGLDLSLEYLQLAKERTGMTALENWHSAIDASEPVELGPLFEDTNAINKT